MKFTVLTYADMMVSLMYIFDYNTDKTVNDNNVTSIILI